MYYNILYLPYKPGTGTSPVRRNVACSCPQLIIAICYDARPPSWWQKCGRSSVHKNQEALRGSSPAIAEATTKSVRILAK